MFAAARDVTERKQIEHVLQEKNVELETAKSTAEKANLAKSDFLSSMSHELRSPLNAILGFAQLMESGSTPSDAVSNKESIAQILKAGWHSAQADQRNSRSCGDRIREGVAVDGIGVVG